MPKPRRHMRWFVAATTAVLSFPPAAAFAAASGSAGDVTPVLGGLVLILVGAMLGGEAAMRLGQPRVLGELVAGIALGNLGLVGVTGLDGLRDLPALEVLAQIGVIFLIFEVGLGSDLVAMKSVGTSALLVATLGVVVPMALGYVASAAFLPAAPALAHVFVGATLSATSVGITARVLGDLGRAGSPEGRIILGAAVIDDVLGLVVLAVVSGVIQAADLGRPFDAGTVLLVVGKAALFLGAALIVGRWVSRRVFRGAAGLRAEGVLLTLVLVFCFGLAALAGIAGLAPIVGAFAAGLILDEAHYAELRGRDLQTRSVPELLRPLSAFLVPVFFVLMGMRVDLGTLGEPGVVVFALALTLAAVVGKQVCSFGVLARGVDRWAVGFGMIPRGEVGLIFAGIGATLRVDGEPVVGPAAYAAVVIMVAFTTLVTPPLLQWRLRPHRGSG